MKLYIKQKLFSFKDKYQILDAFDNVIFDIDNQFINYGTNYLHIYDKDKIEQFLIKRKYTFMIAKYEIYHDNNLFATVSQEIAYFTRKVSIESSYGDFEVNGDLMNREYKIMRCRQFLGSIRKKWNPWGDGFELDVPEDEKVGIFCALVIAIDNCLHTDK
jgi:uncharacterized protein YxjI